LRPRTFWILLTAAIFLSRAAHVNILWADEDYHLAEAVQVLHGKMLYRDVWYDKPPLSALLFTLFGAWPGWPLRLFSMVLELAGAFVSYRFASALWTRREGMFAAAAFVFFHIFYFASAAIPVEPDTLMVLPHLAGVFCAWRGRALWAGVLSGVAFLLNTKGLFVLAACIAIAPSGWWMMLAGFAGPVAVMGAWLGAQGAFGDYIKQVWQWGTLYASNPQPETPLAPLGRLGSWLLFHAALVVGSLVAFDSADGHVPGNTHPKRRKLVLWLAFSLAASCIGWRFVPRYMNQLFPALVIAGSYGLSAMTKQNWTRWVVIALFAFPVVRFGPRYAELLRDDLRQDPHQWSDISMDLESRSAGIALQAMKQPGDTIFVWGYRPNVVAYSRLPVAGQMWDSQPVTMVPADRHLGDATPLDAEWARENQDKLIRTTPTFIVDGLSAYNPELDIHKFPQLAEWLDQHYCNAGSSGRGIKLYNRCK
jgi:hypothetical protein